LTVALAINLRGQYVDFKRKDADSNKQFRAFAKQLVD